MAIGYSLEQTPFGPVAYLPGGSPSSGSSSAINLTLANATLAPAITAPTRTFAAAALTPDLAKKTYALSSGVGASEEEFFGPLAPSGAGAAVGYTQRRADADAAPPYALIAAGVGAVAVGALLFFKLRKRR